MQEQVSDKDQEGLKRKCNGYGGAWRAFVSHMKRGALGRPDLKPIAVKYKALTVDFYRKLGAKPTQANKAGSKRPFGPRPRDAAKSRKRAVGGQDCAVAVAGPGVGQIVPAVAAEGLQVTAPAAVHDDFEDNLRALRGDVFFKAQTNFGPRQALGSNGAEAHCKCAFGKGRSKSGTHTVP